MKDKFFPDANFGTLTLETEGTQFAKSVNMEWRPTGAEGFLTKPLLIASEKGRSTSLMKIEPGAVSQPHTHRTFEEIFVLEGSFYDQDNTYFPGDFVLRAPETVHMAGSKGGALVLVSTFVS